MVRFNDPGQMYVMSWLGRGRGRGRGEVRLCIVTLDIKTDDPLYLYQHWPHNWSETRIEKGQLKGHTGGGGRGVVRLCIGTLEIKTDGSLHLYQHWSNNWSETRVAGMLQLKGHILRRFISKQNKVLCSTIIGPIIYTTVACHELKWMGF